MNVIRDNFIAWLRDAHAMEQQALTMLTAQERRLRQHPQFRARVSQHIAETEIQSDQVSRLLQQYDTGTSTMKDVTAKVMASAQAFGGMFMGDEIVKGAQMSYVFEQLEIASYTILIATARELGDENSVNVLQKILDQEVAMAEWSLATLPDVTKAYLADVVSEQVSQI